MAIPIMDQRVLQYRAMNKLVFIVLGYAVAIHLLAFTVLATYLSYSPSLLVLYQNGVTSPVSS